MTETTRTYYLATSTTSVDTELAKIYDGLDTDFYRELIAEKGLRAVVIEDIEQSHAFRGANFANSDYETHITFTAADVGHVLANLVYGADVDFEELWEAA